MTKLRNLASFSLLQVAADWPKDRRLTDKYLGAKERAHERKQAKTAKVNRGK